MANKRRYVHISISLGIVNDRIVKYFPDERSVFFGKEKNMKRIEDDSDSSISDFSLFVSIGSITYRLVLTSLKRIREKAICR